MSNPSVSTAIKAFSPFGDSEPGTASVQELTSSDCMKRALKTLGIFWGIGVAGVFLPVVHFIIVPTALLLGPIFAIRTYRQKTMISDVKALCPQCKAVLKIDKTAGQWPLKDFCQGCRNQIKIDKA